MSSFDAAARRLHPESYKQEANAAPVVEKKKKQKKRKAEPLPSVGDVVAARGLRKGDDAEATGTVTKIKRAKTNEKKSKRGDRVYRIELEGGGSRKASSLPPTMGATILAPLRIVSRKLFVSLLTNLQSRCVSRVLRDPPPSNSIR